MSSMVMRVGGLCVALALSGSVIAEGEAESAASSSASKYLFGPDEAWDLSDTFLKDDVKIFDEDFNIDLGGWIQGGYHSKSTGLFNVNPDRFNIHQTWLYAEKAVDGSDGFDWGGKASIMYGTDSGDTQSFGNDAGVFDFANGWDHGGAYGWAMPELYAEVAYEDFSLKAGHFYTLLGWEVVTAPDNFFYSHAFTMYNSEAFTHTGALATYQAHEKVELYGGYTLGWDTGFDQNMNGSNFLGGASVKAHEKVNVIFITTLGDFGAIGSGYSHSIVADVALTDDLQYIFQSDLLSVHTRETIGVNQYLIYTVNDVIGVGTRVEWWKADGDSYWGVTAGVNIKPHANLTFRPELRYQWSPSAGFNPEVPEDNGLIFGIDAILTF